MKKILLIPTYHYLANPIYISLKDMFKDQYEFIYFFTKDSTHIEGNLKNISKKKVGFLFDKYVEIEFDAPWIDRITKVDYKSIRKENVVLPSRDSFQFAKYLIKIYYMKIIKKTKKQKYNLKKIIGMFKLTFKIKNYIREFVKIIENIKPDLIIITSDMTMSYRIIKKFFPQIEILVMQPCFLDFRERKLPKFPILNRMMNIFLKDVYYPSQSYYGLENENDKLLLFDENYIELYQEKRKNIYKIINPFYSKLNSDVEKLKTIENKEQNYDKANLNRTKKTIILFLSDYTSVYGAEVQKYLEETYIEIIKENKRKYNFIVKNHPRIGVKNFEKNFVGFDDICFLKEELTYTEMLSLGDLNISINSNASLEALVCGMLTVNFLPLGLDHLENTKSLSRHGAIDLCTSIELKQFIKTFNLDDIDLISRVTDSKNALVGKNNECKKRFLEIFESSLTSCVN